VHNYCDGFFRAEGFLTVRRRYLLSGLVVAAAGLSAPAAHAAVSQEYFNNLGTSSTTIAGTNGGSGWTSAWVNSTANTYTPGSQLTYSATGYLLSGNQSDSDDGLATGTVTSSISFRRTPAMNGTVWVSLLARQSASGGDVLVWLDKTDVSTGGSSRQFMALRGSTGTTGGSTPEAILSYNAATTRPTTPTGP
jgi:hypothetical protein